MPKKNCPGGGGSCCGSCIKCRSDQSFIWQDWADTFNGYTTIDDLPEQYEAYGYVTANEPTIESGTVRLENERVSPWHRSSLSLNGGACSGKFFLAIATCNFYASDGYGEFDIIYPKGTFQMRVTAGRQFNTNGTPTRNPVPTLGSTFVMGDAAIALDTSGADEPVFSKFPGRYYLGNVSGQGTQNGQNTGEFGSDSTELRIAVFEDSSGDFWKECSINGATSGSEYLLDRLYDKAIGLPGRTTMSRSNLGGCTLCNVGVHWYNYFGKRDLSIDNVLVALTCKMPEPYTPLGGP